MEVVTTTQILSAEDEYERDFTGTSIFHSASDTKRIAARSKRSDGDVHSASVRRGGNRNYDVQCFGTTVKRVSTGTFLAAVLIVLTGILLTGGLHLDGWTDTADAFFSYQDRKSGLKLWKIQELARSVQWRYYFLS